MACYMGGLQFKIVDDYHVELFKNQVTRVSDYQTSKVLMN